MAGDVQRNAVTHLRQCAHGRYTAALHLARLLTRSLNQPTTRGTWIVNCHVGSILTPSSPQLTAPSTHLGLSTNIHHLCVERQIPMLCKYRLDSGLGFLWIIDGRDGPAGRHYPFPKDQDDTQTIGLYNCTNQVYGLQIQSI